jgi:thioredoxin-related protein
MVITMQRHLPLFALLSIGWVCVPSSGLAQENEKAKSPSVFKPVVEATEQIKVALAKSKKENRHVLILWGSDASEDCMAFHKSVLSNPKIGKLLRYEYDIVRIDSSDQAKTQTLASRYGAKLSIDAVLYLTVLDANGKPLANQNAMNLPIDGAATAEAGKDGLFEFLSTLQAKPIDANAVLNAALAQAKAENKLVFLHFGAPWCGWCHRMEDWMAKPEIAKLLNNAFVDLKIDTDRMVGGDELLKKYCEKQGGIPWFAFVSASDEVVVNSDGPKGNVGFPSEDFEIEHFAAMLEQTNRFTKDQVTSLAESLAADRKLREKK